MQFMANKEFNCLTDLILASLPHFSFYCVYWMWWSATQAPASGYCEPNVTCLCSIAAFKPVLEAELSEHCHYKSLKYSNIWEICLIGIILIENWYISETADKMTLQLAV